MNTRPRTGWLEPITRGIHRAHSAACPATTTRQTGRRCDCPYTYWQPRTPGSPRRRARVHGTLTDARRAKSHAEHDAAQRRKERHNHQAGMLPMPTLDAWLAHLLDRQWSQTRISTRERRQQDYDARIGPHLGTTRLDRITPATVEAWLYERLDEDGNRRCVQHAYETLRCMLDHAVRARLLHANPVRAVRYPAEAIQTRSQRALSRDEYQTLLDTCRSRSERLIVRILTEAGLRIGEAVELRACDLALDADVPHILVQRRAYQTKAGETDIDSPKSRKARAVAIPTSLADEIMAYLAQRGAAREDHVLTRCHGWTHGKHLPHTDASLRNQLYRIAHRAGIQGVHPHGLRRTGATIAAHAGTPHTIIQAHLGHSRIQTTERYIATPDVGALGAFAAVWG